ERMLTLMQALVRANLAPKRVQLVHNKPGSAPKLVLLDAVKDGHAGLQWLPPLILRDADGKMSEAWRRIYRRD
ncbi:MAG: methyltransferase, partial [Clostridia bacterium]